MDAQRYNGQNVSILNSVPNKPNIQFNLSPVHRQSAGSLVSETGVRVNSCSLQHSDLLPCVRNCLTFLNLLISSAVLSTSELQGLFYLFGVSHHAVL